MDSQLYDNIVHFVRHYYGLSQDCMKILVKQYPQLSYDTLYSILSNEYQKRMKINHSKTQSNRHKYWKLYQEALESNESPGSIVRIAKHFDVAPCLVAKLILSQFFEKLGQAASEQCFNVNMYIRDTSLIPDMDLAYEVFLCTLYDNIYSPLTETMKGSLGQQYEIMLHKKVMELGLAFRDEEHLRKNGYDKTPDCKLDVPIVVDNFIINWIESKALFGDREVHREYMKNQYVSYWNRFGPGLVIYWFGYLETIVEPSDKRFIIRDNFPENIINIPAPNFDMFNLSELNT